MTHEQAIQRIAEIIEARVYLVFVWRSVIWNVLVKWADWEEGRGIVQVETVVDRAKWDTQPPEDLSRTQIDSILRSDPEGWQAACVDVLDRKLRK